MEDNLSAVLVEKGDLRLVQKPKPHPRSNQVLIAVQKVGICGSDVHYWTKGAIGDFVLRAPMVLGHESAGVVVAVGEEVTSLAPGDRVAIEPGVSCGNCDFCRRGRYNLCPAIKFCATPPYDGTLTRFYVHDAAYCFKLPDHVSLEEGALLEPLSVAVHACKRAGVSLGSRVLICGAGPIGLVNLLTAKAMGAFKVVLTDIAENRLQVAKKLGADATVLVTDKAEKMAILIEEALGERPNVTIECSGAESSLRTGILATESGGTVVVVGMGPNEVTLPLTNAFTREVDVRGIFRYAHCYGDALNMVSTGKVNVKPLITHRFELEESLKAFETAKTGAGEAIKVVISCGNKN